MSPCGGPPAVSPVRFPCTGISSGKRSVNERSFPTNEGFATHDPKRSRLETTAWFARPPYTRRGRRPRSNHETLSPGLRLCPVAPRVALDARLRTGRAILAKDTLTDLVQSTCREVIEDLPAATFHDRLAKAEFAAEKNEIHIGTMPSCPAGQMAVFPFSES